MRAKDLRALANFDGGRRIYSSDMRFKRNGNKKKSEAGGKQE